MKSDVGLKDSRKNLPKNYYQMSEKETKSYAEKLTKSKITQEYGKNDPNLSAKTLDSHQPGTTPIKDLNDKEKIKKFTGETG